MPAHKRQKAEPQNWRTSERFLLLKRPVRPPRLISVAQTLLATFSFWLLQDVKMLQILTGSPTTLPDDQCLC